MRKKLDTSICLYWLLNPQSWRGKVCENKGFLRLRTKSLREQIRSVIEPKQKKVFEY